MRTVIEKGVPSRLRGVALTKRETEALKYAARGLTVLDIAPKMGISPRTVRFHIDKATTKLGALKREETIALAVKGGLFDVLPYRDPSRRAATPPGPCRRARSRAR